MLKPCVGEIKPIKALSLKSAISILVNLSMQINLVFIPFHSASASIHSEALRALPVPEK
jgi:hypothetical protein